MSQSCLFINWAEGTNTHMTGNEQCDSFQFLNCPQVPLSPHMKFVNQPQVSPHHLHLLSWVSASFSCLALFLHHSFLFRFMKKKTLKSMLPDSLALCSLALHCVVIDRETSGDFMADWLCLCQVQLGSGCRRLDINTTVMKANTVNDWLKLWLHLTELLLKGNVQQAHGWADAIYIEQHICNDFLKASGQSRAWHLWWRSHGSVIIIFTGCLIRRSLFTVRRLLLSTTASK